MKRLVYTCVFKGYDWVFPPLQPEGSLDYVIITDDGELRVPGWQTVVVDISRFQNAQAANRYYKTLVHREFAEYDCSLYVDGNIRLRGKTSEVFDSFLTSGAGLGLFRHPLRSTVLEEAEICLNVGKITDSDRLTTELTFYRHEGFPDNMGLVEATILLKNHRHSELDRAMELWWQLFERFGTRDQISLPYVLWKTGVPCMYHSTSFRDTNPYFGLYTHRGDKRAPRFYGYVEGRAFDSRFYAAILQAWQFSWSVRRACRSWRRASGRTG